MRNVVAVLLVLMLTACASSRGFDRGNLRGQIPDQQRVTEEDIQRVLELKPQLPSPFTLAIYFVSPSTGSCYGNNWNWLSEDKDTLQSLEAELKGKGILSEVFVISSQIVEESDNQSIRLAAARAGADAVLIVNGVSDIDRYNNALGYTYFLLITPFFIPGTEADGLFMANATMWDVRNQYLYLSAESEGTAKEIKPAVFIDEKRIIKSAKSAALAALKTEISSRLTRIGAK
ncbi:MAG: hypothetical protein GJT30_18260 [Geobacter sp.]|nr:hypothetical protein [Geobacter sp.]